MRDDLLDQRNYWNNTSEIFESIYSKKKNKILIFLDKIFRKDMFQRFTFTIDNCKPVDGKIFLDIGCGTGLFSIELAKLGAEKVYGIDIAENMITISNREAKINNVEGKCEFILSDLLEYYPVPAIDISFGIGLFDYIKNPLPVLEKMYKVSKERAIFSFPRLLTWRMPVRKMRLTLKKCNVYFYSKKRVKNLLEDAGFRKYRIEKIGKLFCAVGYKV